MTSIRDIPEIIGLDGPSGLVRIPPELDVPLTDRVRALVDTPEFRRLSGISQLGLVGLVYPAANHSRFEHSLGVYRLALYFLRSLSGDRRFVDLVTPRDATLFLASALLHDIGHWPFCHPIEDISLPWVPSHESFAATFIADGPIADVLADQWGLAPEEIIETLSGPPRDQRSRVLKSMLSGPIDVDKMDYLMRDSLHAGVPYGRNFDQSRLIRSLCLNREGAALAISEKGKTAAELMVFARYVMFSEVYWHHAVRSATAMLQRAFYLLHDSLDLDALFRATQAAFIDQMRAAAAGDPAADLVEGLFGADRGLYKRLAQFNIFQQPELYARLARRPYPWLVRCAEQFAELAGGALGERIAPHEVLFDAPPVAREVEFDIEVYFSKENVYRPLGEVSPVVRALAERQFDDYVKRVRVFVHPRLAAALGGISDLPGLLEDAINRLE
jgi:HD superfamily phosphohydrolase